MPVLILYYPWESSEGELLAKLDWSPSCCACNENEKKYTIYLEHSWRPFFWCDRFSPVYLVFLDMQISDHYLIFIMKVFSTAKHLAPAGWASHLLSCSMITSNGFGEIIVYVQIDKNINYCTIRSLNRAKDKIYR